MYIEGEHGNLIHHPTPKFHSYHHRNSTVSPLTDTVVRALMAEKVFDPTLPTSTIGMRALYQAHLDDDGAYDKPRAIAAAVVCMLADKPIGACILRRVGDDHQVDVYVKSDQRRQGLGRQLLRSMSSLAPAVKPFMRYTPSGEQLWNDTPRSITLRLDVTVPGLNQRCDTALQALRSSDRWVGVDSGELDTASVIEVLQAQRDLINKLRIGES